MFDNDKEVEKITVTYADGSEKAIDRGACFSVCEEGDTMRVAVDGVGSEEDCIAILTIISRAAKEFDITDELIDKVEGVKHAEWQRQKNGFYFLCSNCGKAAATKGNYCHSCGAKMDGGNAE